MMPAALRPGRVDMRTRSARPTRIAPTTADAIRAAGLMLRPAESNDTQGRNDPTRTATPPAIATDAAPVPRAWGRSSTQNGQPCGGAGHDGSGRQPGGTCQPGGGDGQPGGALNCAVMTASFPGMTHYQRNARMVGEPYPARESVVRSERLTNMDTAG